MKKVLIIEDDPPYRKIYKKKFEVAGFLADVAENGIEGLKKMRSFAPDIVFVDLMMPKMDGFHVLDAAKADPGIKSIPIVVLTNLSTTDNTLKAKEKGAAAVIVKSDVEPEVIVEKANEVLGIGNGKVEPHQDLST